MKDLLGNNKYTKMIVNKILCRASWPVLLLWKETKRRKYQHSLHSKRIACTRIRQELLIGVVPVFLLLLLFLKHSIWLYFWHQWHYLLSTNNTWKESHGLGFIWIYLWLENQLFTVMPSSISFKLHDIITRLVVFLKQDVFDVTSDQTVKIAA